ncbi:hypothetical protein BDZ89DRAFT_1073921 [Hymenopellis radicata]|nr:hypothetical protein BDZ89DRAFT_1073921 [Hymenopellis radicata]
MDSYWEDRRRHLLAAEEERLLESLSVVRSKVNTLAPIGTLPPEMLQAIFDMCISFVYDNPKPRHRLAWTQVCRLWRTIALDTPRLWRYIDLCDANYAREFLARSRRVPLSIICISPCRLFTESLHPHTKRLKSIDVYLFPNDMITFFHSIGPDLSHLTHLSLQIPPVSVSCTLDVSFPSVRHLSLRGVAVDWSSCRNLTYLALESLPTDLCPTLSELMGVIQRSPRLKHLRLNDIQPFAEAISTEHACMPNIEEVTLTGDPDVIGLLFANFSYMPPTARLVMNATYPDLFLLFPEVCPYRDGLDIHTLRITRHALHMSRTEEGSWAENSMVRVHAKRMSVVLLTSAQKNAFERLRAHQFTALELDTNILFDVSAHSLRDMFLGLCAVETLRVSFNEIGALLQVLGQMIWPGLRHIELGKPKDVWWRFQERWIGPLTACLKARFEMRMGLESVKFIRCQHVSWADVGALGEFVDSVEIIPVDDLEK